MNRLTAYTCGLVLAAGTVGAARAGDASTSAFANSGSGRNDGTAGATADYDGNGGVGYARTRSQTGRINLARGFAVGFDRNGIDLSFSHAIAGQRGPGYAGTFNMSLGRDGSVATSYGDSLARGGRSRSVQAGGTTRSSRNGTTSLARANGRTHHGGYVQARTQSRHRRPARPRFARVVHRRPRFGW